MIIAIDGPAGAGKSTIAKIVASNLGFLYIDTGAMYRALTLKVIEQNIDFRDKTSVIGLANNTNIDLKSNSEGILKVILDGKDVSGLIREPRITKLVSDIAKIKEVRRAMLGLQRNLGRSGSSVLDGRDIGTVVFPDADKKFYLDARLEERARRRHKELEDSGLAISPEDVAKDIKNRDTIDSTREVAPLKKADDAIYIDTTGMTIEEVVKKVLSHIRQNG
jgi:cytidylate kinase